jgi:hypothetical protein
LFNGYILITQTINYCGGISDCATEDPALVIDDSQSCFIVQANIVFTLYDLRIDVRCNQHNPLFDIKQGNLSIIHCIISSENIGLEKYFDLSSDIQLSLDDFKVDGVNYGHGLYGP